MNALAHALTSQIRLASVDLVLAIDELNDARVETE